MFKYQMQGPMGARTVINGRERDYFAGCGYLGLQGDPMIIQAVHDATLRYGVATGTARSTTGFGDSPIYVEFDREATLFFDAERILYFPSGYFGLIILAQGLKERYERIFIDEGTHYSGWDGARLTGKPITPFSHRDVGSLADACGRELGSGERPVVLSDGVFPVSGTIAPAKEYLEIVERYDGLVCLDDAHATGVLGADGRGTLDHYELEGSERCFAAHTLSKALGSYGGLIAGDRQLMEELDRHSRVQFGASRPPLAIAAAASRALALARAEPERRQQLWTNVSRARAGLRALGWPVPDSPSPIISLGSRPGLDMIRAQERLIERDICIAYVGAYNDVPEGGLLRIAIFSTHTSDQIDRLISEVGRIL
jgi:glycine C-acetyltransferase/8-amino-7-oxononanoate synthase